MLLLKRGHQSLRLFRPLQRVFATLTEEVGTRGKEKLINNLKSVEAPIYWNTSSRPAHFGEPLDIITKPDNWFDENRMWNEEDRDYKSRRSKMYVFDALQYGFWVALAGLGLKWVYERWLRRQWKIEDTYAEFDISGLQPGKVVTAEYLGRPIFIRLLTYDEVETASTSAPAELWDSTSYTATSEYGDKQLLVVYAETDRGTIPQTFKGEYGGWACSKTKQVFDKFGRSRKVGKRGKNLQYVNHVIHGNILCLEQRMKYNANYSLYYI